ncbi:hypothetical protein [Streptomyces sp. NPDC006739]|uniref:hypothetical protein n=1 Tax=Streptomyces sp. NPDC006739 TaxID=3364763 RepID=UPI0036A888D1
MRTKAARRGLPVTAAVPEGPALTACGARGAAGAPWQRVRFPSVEVTSPDESHARLMSLGVNGPADGASGAVVTVAPGGAGA